MMLFPSSNAGTCTDIHDNKMAEAARNRQIEIMANEKKYRLLAEAIPQIVFTTTPEKGLTYANAKWFGYSGQTFEQTKGLGFMSHVHPVDRGKCKLPDVSNGQDGEVGWQEEVRLESKDGEYRWFLVKCISVEESEQGGRKWFGTCTDINDHKVLEHKLKEAHDAAQKSTESKTRFLSNMSHEIRTPLIGITGMINFMLDTDLTVEQLDYAHTIQQSAESLLVVINDILDLSKVEAGMMKLEMEPFSISTMIEDANELLSTLAIQKGLELSFWIEDDVPEVVNGDRVRLRQVLLNLIGNAIKFTNTGEIFTRCSTVSYDDSALQLVLLFEVVDTGTGFDAEEEAVMFKPFSQVDTSSTRKHGGSGLGLVISRQLIELHGGKMSCEGSTFYFTVTFTIPPPLTEPRPQTPNEETVKSPFFRPNRAFVHSSRPHSNSSVSSASTTSSSASVSSSSSFGLNTTLNSPKLSLLLGGEDLPKQRLSIMPTTNSRFSLAAMEANLTNNAATMKLSLPPHRAAKEAIDKDNVQRRYSDTFFSAGSGSRDSKQSLERNRAGDTLEIKNSLPVGFQANASMTSSDDSSHGRLSLSSSNIIRVLVISEWPRSRSATVNYIRSLLRCHRNSHVDSVASHTEAETLLIDRSTIPYDFLFVDLSSQPRVLSLAQLIRRSPVHANTITIIITTPMQRYGIVEGAQSELPNKCEFVFKPLKRSKLEPFFDGKPHQANSHPRRMASAQQAVASQKEVFMKMEKDVGGRGYRVLLVEGKRFVNQAMTDLV
ncbi:hypothetical protein BC938DRAFT_481703 [Jimgerdemannia flammicorona]|uniref:histidine kinase n=1 Tax=Jimgerdemannia flammicorona TaxID=994334 RepID=A0A433QG80_9FUNG|nr:hypothetical protein BC938DRAFT_481703 [Jimgerdemannia flammicorona]